MKPVESAVELDQGLTEMGVSVTPGVDMGYRDLPLAQLEAKRVAERLEAELRNAVGPLDRE